MGRAKLVSTPQPFLKWPGGKRRLLPQLRPLLPADVATRRHVEPFAGGAALFFESTNPSARLSDVNENLIVTYTAVRDELDNVVEHLRDLAQHHSERNYYRVRSRYNRKAFACGAELAATLIYLNKTCFNGLYRVNRSGHFNVPIGRYKRPTILDLETLQAASVRLRGVELRAGDFHNCLDDVGPRDFVYLDPPYQPKSKTSSFRAYAANGFTEDDQRKLHAVFVELARRNTQVLLSNSDTPLIRTLYKGWPMTKVRAGRSISSNGAGRGVVTELVIRSHA